MKDILADAFDKQKKYAELIAKGIEPNVALSQAFGSDIANKTIHQLRLIKQSRYN